VSRPGIGVLGRFLMAGVTLHRSPFNKNGVAAGNVHGSSRMATFRGARIG
jgi:hypothetical protein